MGAKYKITPPGEVIHPWINKPDTKFNADGLFKANLALTGAEAAKLQEYIDAEIETAYAELTKDMTAKERNAYKKVAPYEVETDDDEKPTGRTIFHFKQNAKIKLKDGTTKDISIGIYDSKDNETKAPIGGGSVLKVMFTVRPFKHVSQKAISVRLDFAKVQIVSLKTFSASAGFGAVEGGFVDEGGFDAAPTSDNDSPDY